MLAANEVMREEAFVEGRYQLPTANAAPMSEVINKASLFDTGIIIHFSPGGA